MAGKRSQARQHAVQAIYQWQLTGHDIRDIDRQFLLEHGSDDCEVAYFQELLHGVPANLTTLDEKLSPCLDRAIESVDPVERAILRLGAFELVHHLEVPYRVVINEAVELAKLFGAEHGHKYVNGVLDKLAHEVRAAEME
jgi:N utilization substance protein B